MFVLSENSVIFAKHKLRSGNIKSGKTLFSRLDVALTLHHTCHIK